MIIKKLSLSLCLIMIFSIFAFNFSASAINVGETVTFDSELPADFKVQKVVGGDNSDVTSDERFFTIDREAKVGGRTDNSVKFTSLGDPNAATRDVRIRGRVFTPVPAEFQNNTSVYTVEFDIFNHITDTADTSILSSWHPYILVWAHGADLFRMSDTFLQDCVAWQKYGDINDYYNKWNKMSFVIDKSAQTFTVYDGTGNILAENLQASFTASHNFFIALEQYDLGQGEDCYMAVDNITFTAGNKIEDAKKIKNMGASISRGTIAPGNDITITVDPGTVKDTVTSVKYILTLRKGGRLIGMEIAEKTFDTTDPANFDMTIGNIQPGTQTGDYELKLMLVEDFAKLDFLCNPLTIGND